jgi:hypothetical protein
MIDTMKDGVAESKNDVLKQEWKCDICRNDELGGFVHFNGIGTICDHCADIAMKAAIEKAIKERKESRK